MIPILQHLGIHQLISAILLGWDENEWKDISSQD
jgi:hypothetical protein